MKQFCCRMDLADVWTMQRRVLRTFRLTLTNCSQKLVAETCKYWHLIFSIVRPCVGRVDGTYLWHFNQKSEWLSLYRDRATSLTVMESGLDSWAGNVQTCPATLVFCTYWQRAKQRGREAEYLPPSKVDLRIVQLYIHFPIRFRCVTIN
jgi:hypothetical protein